MFSTVATVSVPDAVVVVLALLFGGYEAWLALAAHRSSVPHWREHAWVAVSSLCAGVFAAGMFAQYNGDQVTAEWATRVEALALVGLMHAMVAFAMEVSGRNVRRHQLYLAASCLFWFLFYANPWLPTAVEARSMWGLPQPFYRKVDDISSLVGPVFGMGLVCWASYLLLRHGAEQRRDARWFGLGVVVWLVAGVHDVLQAAFADVMWPNLLEYGFFGFVTALVARDLHRHREMLDRSRRDFRLLIERTPDAVAVVRAGRLIWLNPAIENLLGHDVASLLGESTDRVIDRESRRRLLHALVEGRGAAGPFGAVLKRADGSPIEVELVALRIKFDGAPAIVVVARDVTERRQLTARLIEMDRIITAGTLSAGVGHEINNPLAYAMLNLREARRLAGYAHEVELDELLASSEEGLARVQGVVRALRSFARTDDRDTHAVVEDTVVSAIAVVGNEVRLRARLEIDLAPDLAVPGGTTRLAQILTNLLVNAAQAIPEGAPENNRVLVRSRGTADEVLIDVVDTGTGIDPSIEKRIFDPFFTTKAATVGTGLGLSICFDKVRELGGEIIVDSEVGAGTTVTVRLPRVEIPTELDGGRERTSDAWDPAQCSVLIVDDEHALLRALERSLRRHATVTTAASTEEALALFEAGQSYDLVLSDLMMPGDSGVVLYERVQEKWPALAERMVFMSGGAFTHEARLFAEAMGARMLTKPVEVEEILKHLQQLRSEAPRLSLRSVSSGSVSSP